MTFRSKLSVRFGDIDLAGIVYYPRYIDYFHVALEDYFSQELNVAYHDIIHTHRIGLPTVHVESDFHRPFDYGDTLEVEVSVLNLGVTSVTFGYKVFKKNEIIPRIVGSNVVVCMDLRHFQKIKFPAWLRQKFEEKIV